MRSIFLSLFLGVSFSCFPAEVWHKNYDWDSIPQQFFYAEKELIIKEFQSIEFIADSTQKIEQYTLNHKIIWVNSDDAINRNNRIYIPLLSSDEIIKQQARVINSKGEIRVLSNENIQEAKDESTGSVFKYFALEGLDKGSHIEYLSFIKSTASYNGTNLTVQMDIPIHKFEFELMSPKEMIFTSKSYNGLDSLQLDTSIEGKNRLFLSQDSIDGLQYEKSSNYQNYLMRLTYKLKECKAPLYLSPVDFTLAASAFCSTIYDVPLKREKKLIKKLLKQTGITDEMDEQTKVRTIENYLKNRFSILPTKTIPGLNLEAMLDNNISSEKGITAMFALLFEKAGITHELVLTSDRFEIVFDTSFESYTVLREFLIYLPNIQSFLAPAIKYRRLNEIPSGWRNNYGLFMRAERSKHGVSGTGSFKFIPPMESVENQHNITINAKLDDDLSAVKMTMELEMTGEYASSFQPYYTDMDDELIDKTNRYILKSIIEDAKIDSVSSENGGVVNFGLKPFYVKGKMQSEMTLEKAGKKVLFKVGELIGPQLEMYLNEDRKLPIEEEYKRQFNHTITVEFPKEYTVLNLEELNRDISYSEDGEKAFWFKSVYTFEGNRLEIKINEVYNEMTLPASKIADYRKVINAAADFNKVVLVLVKK